MLSAQQHESGMMAMDERLDLQSYNSQSSSYSSFLSDQEPGSHTGDSFNGFDHQEAHRINNADKREMLDYEHEFDSEEKRLNTFTRWPVDSPVKPRDLAAAGFYSSEFALDDLVVCCKCHLRLKQWKPGDDPWKEHKLCNPECPYILEWESENGISVIDGPVVPSSKYQGYGEIPLSQNHPRYQNQNYQGEPTRFDVVSSTRVSSYLDHNGVPYSERPQYFTPEEYSYPEQPYYPVREQEFLGRKSTQFQHPEQQTEGTETNSHFVVRQGSSQVHIIGSGPMVYQLDPKDKLVIHSGNQGNHPQQVGPVKYPEGNQFPSKFGTNFTVPRVPLQYREAMQYRIPSSEEPMSGRYCPPSSSVSTSSSGQFQKQPRYEYSIEESLHEGKRTAEFYRSVSHSTVLPQGEKAKYLQYQDRIPSEGKLKYMNTMHKTSTPNPPPFSQKVPGQTHYKLHTPEQPISYEEELLQENCSQQYPVTRETGPYPPPVETNKWQTTHSPTGHGARRPTLFEARPVVDPSLQPRQQPLIRHEDARHITSTADLSSEHHRLTTFVDWPHDHPIRPLDLAAAGFYYLGKDDCVKCYRCGTGLNNWEPTDTPWGEHQKHAPECPLVLEYFAGLLSQREHPTSRQSTTTQDRFTSPQEAFQYQQSYDLQDQQVRMKDPVRSSELPVHGTWGRSESHPPPAVSRVVRPQNPRVEQHHPYWHTQPMTTSQEEVYVTSRRQSSSSGSESGSSQNQRSCSPRGSAAPEFDMEKFAEMGFTQQQVNDTIEERLEATGSTFASYAELVSALLEKQGQQPVLQTCSQTTQQRCEPASPPPPLTIPTDFTSPLPRENQIFPERNCVSAVTSPTTTAPDVNSLRRSFSTPARSPSESGEESLEEKLERMQEERMCKICMDAEVSMVFRPCGHLTCCGDCASGVDLCPMCRAPILEKFRTYLS